MLSRLALTLISLLLCGTSQTGAEKERVFEVTSVKPSPVSGGTGVGQNDPVSYSSHRVTLKWLTAIAYDVPDTQVTGGPAWAATDWFDVDAKTSSPATRPEMMVMLRAVLAERFQLTFHREVASLPAYALIIAKGGPKIGPGFHPSKEGDAPPVRTPGVLAVRNSMKQLSSIITVYLKIAFPSAGEPPLSDPEPLPVIDQTGLTGTFDITLDLQKSRDWFVVLEQQLGLKLEPRKVSAEMLVIDRASRPSAN
jgi:uncharacterized protein (TIGR03435 family)